MRYILSCEGGCSSLWGNNQTQKGKYRKRRTMIVTIKGLDSSVQKFDSLAVVSALNAGIKKSIFILSGTAKKETPVGVTGFLRNAFRERFD